MKVMLLGTSAAEGWPGLFCDCEACAKARALRGKNIRMRSSALIDSVLKIDLPPDTLYQVIAFDLDLRAMKALLLTHGHDDHISVPELQYTGDFFVTRSLSPPLPIYGPPDTLERIRAGLDLENLPITLQPLEAWKPVDIAGYVVTPVIAQHDWAQTCFNYIIRGPDGARLLYATDTGWYDEETWSFLREQTLDALVLECTKGPVEGGYTGHLSIPDVIRMREKLIHDGALGPDSRVVTTHHSHHGGLMHDELERCLSGHNIAVGYDGMSFDVAASPADPRS
jgi:phosphoribosyl 1,2-cyclic phosphate phosphodiesterase